MVRAAVGRASVAVVENPNADAAVDCFRESSRKFIDPEPAVENADAEDVAVAVSGESFVDNLPADDVAREVAKAVVAAEVVFSSNFGIEHDEAVAKQRRK